MILLSFKHWLLPENEENGVRSFLKPNPNNPRQKFVVLYGNTFPIKDELKKIGFRFFKGTWSLGDWAFSDDVKIKLKSLGVDLSGLEVQEPTPAPTAPVDNKQDSQVDKMLANMSAGIKDVMDDSDGQSKALLNYIDRVIEQVANSVDEAAKQSFIRNFLNFASKFHNYSLHNQLLIWIQSRGKAEHVAGAQNWIKLGRQVSKWDEGIIILRPNFKKINRKTTDPKTGVEKEEPFELKFFKATKVYDVSSTTVIPGHNNPFQPMTRNDWSKDSNENLEEITALVNALVAWIKEKGIDFDVEKMASDMGGFSMGGKIRVNDTFAGINFFSTLVHETAHEILHWLGRGERSDKSSSSRQREIDAESVAYVVLHHFGFDTKDTANYLALWRASGEDVRQRRQNIQKASKEIIEAIRSKISHTTQIDDEEQAAA